MRALLKRVAKAIPPFRRLIDERDSLARELESWKKHFTFPPGHYYSPIPSPEDVAEAFSQGVNQLDLPGVDLNTSTQLKYWSIVKDLYPSQPFEECSNTTNRYGFSNQAFCYADAITLQTFLRHFRPKRVVEIGSGHSSAAMLDINEQFLDGTIQFTFIDPHPERLESLLRNTDRSRVNILPQRVQDVTSNPWQSLHQNDILFIVLAMGPKPSPSGESFRFYAVWLQLAGWKTIGQGLTPALTSSTTLCG